MRARPMTDKDVPAPHAPWRKRQKLPGLVLITYVAKILAVVALSLLSHRSIQQRANTAEQTRVTTAKLIQLEQVLTDLKDAETGQRGYLLSGEDRYLDPYRSATSQIPMALA